MGVAFIVPVEDQKVRAHVRAFGVGLVPGGQQLDVTDQPVTTAGETQPAGRTDGCRSGERGALKAGPGPSRAAFPRSKSKCGAYC